MGSYALPVTDMQSVQNNTHNAEDQFHSRPGQPRNYNVLFVLSLTYDLL